MTFSFCMICVAFSLGSSNLFLHCIYGRIASESFEDMTVDLYRCNWIGLPNNLQKYLITMLIFAQTPITYHGFGIVELNMETLASVSSSVFFLIFGSKQI